MRCDWRNPRWMITPGKTVCACLDELFDQPIVVFAGYAMAALADIERIVEQGPRYWCPCRGLLAGRLGIDAGARGVERKFSHRDAHAVGAKVSRPRMRSPSVTTMIPPAGASCAAPARCDRDHRR